MPKLAIEADIQKDFDHAYTGIVQLPDGAKRGVYLAYKYYLRVIQQNNRNYPQQKF